MSGSLAKVAVIAGVGPGTGASLAEAFARIGYSVALLARREESLKPVEQSITSAGGKAVSFPSTDVSDADSIKQTFKAISEKLPGDVEVAIFNASGSFARKPFLELVPEDLEKAMRVSSLGAFIFAQESLRAMEKHKNGGSLFFTGATASLKGSALFAAFAPAKFATRALAQSLAREYGPKGVHVVHVIVDGLIDTPAVKGWAGSEFEPGTRLEPDAIAEAYVFLHQQPKNCWTQELDLRPSKEKF